MKKGKKGLLNTTQAAELLGLDKKEFNKLKKNEGFPTNVGSKTQSRWKKEDLIAAFDMSNKVPEQTPKSAKPTRGRPRKMTATKKQADALLSAHTKEYEAVSHKPVDAKEYFIDQMARALEENLEIIKETCILMHKAAYENSSQMFAFQIGRLTGELMNRTTKGNVALNNYKAHTRVI